MASWKKEGTEPIYVCEDHARELGCAPGECLISPSRSAQTSRNEKKEDLAEPVPAAAPQRRLSVPSVAEMKPALSLAELSADLDKQIGECTTHLENILSQSGAAISVADTIDSALEQATLDMIRNESIPEAQKDATIHQLGALQESLKQGVGRDIMPYQAHQIKQAVSDCLSGNLCIADEARPAYCAVHDRLEQAVHAAVPEAKPIEELLSDLLKKKAEMESLPQAAKSDSSPVT